MVNGKAALTARTKARQAKASLDAERAEQDRLVVDAATEFYEAADAVTTAQAAQAEAEQQRTASVVRLVELGQSDNQVATLCDLTTKEVRDLRRRAASAATAAPSPADAPSTQRPGTENLATEKPATDSTSAKAAA